MAKIVYCAIVYNILQVFTAGITNKLVGCRQQDDLQWSDMVLIRIYGAGSELLIDR